MICNKNGKTKIQGEKSVKPNYMAICQLRVSTMLERSLHFPGSFSPWLTAEMAQNRQRSDSLIRFTINATSISRIKYIQVDLEAT